jgi:hypothetical protein
MPANCDIPEERLPGALRDFYSSDASTPSATEMANGEEEDISISGNNFSDLACEELDKLLIETSVQLIKLSDAQAKRNNLYRVYYVCDAAPSYHMTGEELEAILLSNNPRPLKLPSKETFDALVLGQYLNKLLLSMARESLMRRKLN